MKEKKYNMAFIGGGLLRKESLEVAKLYLEIGDWGLVRSHALEDNVLQSKRLSSAKRVISEVVSRLSVLDQNELTIFVSSNTQDQGYLLWIAICRCYDFVAEFAVEVLHDRHVSLRMDISQQDFAAFINKKAEWHPEIDNLTDSSKNKVRQIIFRILREADLLGKDHNIQPVILSQTLREAVLVRKPGESNYFPMLDTQNAELA